MPSSHPVSVGNTHHLSPPFPSIYLSSVLIYSFPIILYLSVLTYTYLYSILIRQSDPARSIGVDG
jgi:hypothetical protein